MSHSRPASLFGRAKILFQKTEDESKKLKENVDVFLHEVVRLSAVHRLKENDSCSSEVLLFMLKFSWRVQNLEEEEVGQDLLIKGMEIVTIDVRKGIVKAEAITVGESKPIQHVFQHNDCFQCFVTVSPSLTTCNYCWVCLQITVC